MVESGEGVKKKKWKKIVRAGFAPTHRKAPILGRIRKERDTMREEGKQGEMEGPLACEKRIIDVSEYHAKESADEKVMGPTSWALGAP